MKHRAFDVQLLSAGFTGGHKPEAVELRAPTIRGQVRWWFRALGADREQEAAVFGGVHGQSLASAVKMRVSTNGVSQTQRMILPHKKGAPGRGHPRNAVLEGTRFQISMLERPLLSKADGNAFEMAEISLETWLCLGAMGFRSNRGAGSVWPEDGPETEDELRQTLFSLRERALRLGFWSGDSRLGQAKIDLLDKGFASAEEARAICTDTILHPSGALGFVQGRDRQASPLKVKIIPLSGADFPFRIMRVGFTHNELSPTKGIELLNAAGKALGGPGVNLL